MRGIVGEELNALYYPDWDVHAYNFTEVFSLGWRTLLRSTGL
jgi:hypothetical protein